MEDVSEITIRQKRRMSSMADIMDAEETVDWIERRCSVVAITNSKTIIGPSEVCAISGAT